MQFSWYVTLVLTVNGKVLRAASNKNVRKSDCSNFIQVCHLSLCQTGKFGENFSSVASLKLASQPQKCFESQFTSHYFPFRPNVTIHCFLSNSTCQSFLKYYARSFDLPQLKQILENALSPI